MRYGEFMIERLVGRLAEMSTRNSTPKELAAAMYEAVQVIEQLRKAGVPAGLDRSRWKGCEYCKAKIYVKTKNFFRPLLAPATYIEELRNKLEDLTGEVYVEISKRYCPFCGRPITEEAWADLERRIGGL